MKCVQAKEVPAGEAFISSSGRAYRRLSDDDAVLRTWDRRDGLVYAEMLSESVHKVVTAVADCALVYC